MGFESRAISARVTKQIVTIFSKTCDNSICCLSLPVRVAQQSVKKCWRYSTVRRSSVYIIYELH